MTVEYHESEFRAAADATGGVRDKVQDVIDTLTRSTASRGEPWGNDELGNSFATGDSGYRTARGNLVTGARNVVGTLDQFHDGQVDSANMLRDMEDGNRDGFR